MVEEFMLLANVYTAEKTRIEFPHSAVLRRHPRPPETNFHPLIKVATNKVLCFVFIIIIIIINKVLIKVTLNKVILGALYIACG